MSLIKRISIAPAVTASPVSFLPYTASPLSFANSDRNLVTSSVSFDKNVSLIILLIAPLCITSFTPDFVVFEQPSVIIFFLVSSSLISFRILSFVNPGPAIMICSYLFAYSSIAFIIWL